VKAHEKDPIWAEVLILMKGEGMDLAEDGGKNPRCPASSTEQTIKYHFKRTSKITKIEYLF